MEIKKESILRQKTMQFAIRIVEIYKFLQIEQKEYVLSKQLLKSGTSIGANCRESECAQSKADFISKLSISQKECNETLYWLELLFNTHYIDNVKFNATTNEAVEILRMLSASIITAKKSINKL